MLSLMAATTLGLFLISSRAKRTAQMNAAAMRRAFLGGSDTHAIVGEYTAKGQVVGRMWGARALLPLVLIAHGASSQSPQFIETGSTISEVAQKGFRLEALRFERQSAKGRFSRTIGPVMVGAVLVYDPVEGIDQLLLESCGFAHFSVMISHLKGPDQKTILENP